jgi:hypothetical protein
VQIAEAYRRKIEAIVRKPSGTGRGGEEEEQELLSPCPHCSCRSPATSLDCSQCLGRIPYCIVTGMRMVTHDWTICPSCRFPALYSKFLSVITADKVQCRFQRTDCILWFGILGGAQCSITVLRSSSYSNVMQFDHVLVIILSDMLKQVCPMCEQEIIPTSIVQVSVDSSVG